MCQGTPYSLPPLGRRLARRWALDVESSPFLAVEKRPNVQRPILNSQLPTSNEAAGRENDVGGRLFSPPLDPPPAGARSPRPEQRRKDRSTSAPRRKLDKWSTEGIFHSAVPRPQLSGRMRTGAAVGTMRGYVPECLTVQSKTLSQLC